MTIRSSLSYGRRQEYKAIAELLGRNFDVYSTLVDDQGIDCVIRVSAHRYLDIQIKARSSANCKLSQRGFFPQLAIPEPRDNYFFIFYSEHLASEEELNCYWVIPSLEIVRMAEEGGYNVTRMKSGNNVGKISVRVMGTSGRPLPQFDQYRGIKGFELLK